MALLFQFDAAQYARNFTYLFYGLTAVWLVLLVFVLMLAARERRLRRELDRVRLMVEDRDKERKQ